jgi:pimeloyl-ACP methyl ester carboxylesterase
VVVLDNSLGTTREVWDPQAQSLAELFRLLRFERRGHGGRRPRPACIRSASWAPTSGTPLLHDFLQPL